MRKSRGSKRKRRGNVLSSEEDIEGSVEPLAKRACIMVKDGTDTKGNAVKEPEQSSLPIPSDPTSDHSSDLQEPSLKTAPGSVTSSIISQESSDQDNLVDKDKSVIAVSDEVKAKKLHLVVGVNAVTRQLEQGRLKAGLVCSTSPGLLYQHILPLAATREVPFAALPDLSKMLARLLGIKKAMCIGWKVSV